MGSLHSLPKSPLLYAKNESIRATIAQLAKFPVWAMREFDNTHSETLLYHIHNSRSFHF